MGQCCLKRENKSLLDRLSEHKSCCKEENIIHKKEQEVPFFRIKIKQLEDVLEVHQYDHKLNNSHIRKVVADLKLNLDMLSNPSCVEFKFFEYLMDPDKLYCQRKLVLSSVLTCSEPPEKKFGVVGKYYDFSANNLLEIDEIEMLLTEIVDISVICIPKIAISEEANQESLSVGNILSIY